MFFYIYFCKFANPVSCIVLLLLLLLLLLLFVSFIILKMNNFAYKPIEN